MPAPLLGPFPYTPDWYAVRNVNPNLAISCRLGASEAAAICGMSRYETPLEVYMRKMGLLGERPINEQQKKWGKKREALILEEYEERTKQKLFREVSMYYHPDFPWIAATPDAIVVDHQTDIWLKAVDAKTTVRRMFKEEQGWGEPGTDEVPVEIFMQAQQQMVVCGLELQETALVVDGYDFFVYRIPYDLDLGELIKDRCNDMYSRLCLEQPPDQTPKHRSTPYLMKRLYAETNHSTMFQASSELQKIWDRRQKVNKILNAGKKIADQLTGRLLAEFESRERAILPDGRSVKRSTVHVDEHVVKASTQIRFREEKV